MTWQSCIISNTQVLHFSDYQKVYVDFKDCDVTKKSLSNAPL